MGHAEALLLVDDDEPEVLPVNVLRQEAMRADDDVAAPVLEEAQGLALLGLRLEAGHRADGDGIVA